jgi:heavy metal efflux system protein
VEISEGSGELRLEVDREALAAQNVTAAAVQEVVELAMGTRTATELVDGPRRIGVVTRVPAAQREDAEALGGLLVRSEHGAIVPVNAVARLVMTTGPEVIAHEDAQRRTLVMANVRGRDLGSFVEEVRGRVAAEVPLPGGVFLEWGGQYENQARALKRLELVVPAALLLIFALLFATFGSVTQSALVLTNVPFALVGGVTVLWLRGLNLSLSASVGFIALFGIAVLNGVVLVSRMNGLRASGMPIEDAVRHGALDRLRPVLMTALVASLGFIPMALSTNPGAEVQRPLATVVIGGLVTSTLLTLFVLPTLYGMLARWEARRALERSVRGS